jgi:hypothetical protein
LIHDVIHLTTMIRSGPIYLVNALKRAFLDLEQKMDDGQTGHDSILFGQSYCVPHTKNPTQFQYQVSKCLRERGGLFSANKKLSTSVSKREFCLGTKQYLDSYNV